VLNRSQIRTVIVCALIINLQEPNALGNVLLEVGETALSEQSVVNVSQIFTVNKALLTEKLAVCQNSVFSKFWQVGHWLQNRKLSINAIELAYYDSRAITR
jgi:mRNA-degrading endonuclease toxin of MazEF toxin-antitoxin module